MDVIFSKEVDCWSFPDLKFGQEKINDDQILQENKSSLEIDEDNTPDCSAEPSKIDHAEIIRIALLEKEKELDDLKIEYEQKIALVNNIITKFENPLSELDDQIMELVHYIIKKSVKNLIYKEMKLDSKLVNRIVKELAELIKYKDGMLTVYLSEKDYKIINENQTNLQMTFKINPALNEGDVVVSSNYSEIRSIVNDRLNQMLGIKYV